MRSSPRRTAETISSFPAFHIDRGLRDHLPEANRSIAKAVAEAGADVACEEGEAIRDRCFRDEYIQRVLKWLNYHAARKAWANHRGTQLFSPERPPTRFAGR